MKRENGVEINIIDSTVEPRCSGLTEGEHRKCDSFWQSICFLTTSMRLFGLYFKSDHQLSSATKFEKILNKFCRYYSFSMVIIHWLNFVRFLSIFTQDNPFGPILFNRLQYLIWYELTAVTITCMYLACKSGKLSKAMASTGNSDGSEQFIRKQALIISLVTWVCVVFYISTDTYNNFLLGDYADNSVLTPLVTLIPTDGLNVFAVKVVYLIIMSNGDACTLFLTAFYLQIALIFATEFKSLNEEFKTK